MIICIDGSLGNYPSKRSIQISQLLMSYFVSQTENNMPIKIFFYQLMKYFIISYMVARLYINQEIEYIFNSS